MSAPETLEQYAERSRHLAGLSWVRWWHRDALGDLRVRRLPDELKGAYVWVLSLAASNDVAPGALVDDEGAPLDADAIARDTGLRPETVRKFLERARRSGVLLELDGGVLYFPTFVGRQITAKELEKARGRSERGRAAALIRHDRDRARRANADANARTAAPANADANARANADAYAHASQSHSQKEPPPPARERPQEANGGGGGLDELLAEHRIVPLPRQRAELEAAWRDAPDGFAAQVAGVVTADAPIAALLTRIRAGVHVDAQAEAAAEAEAADTAAAGAARLKALVAHGLVSMRNPEGDTFAVPAPSVEQRQAAGWTLAERHDW